MPLELRIKKTVATDTNFDSAVVFFVDFCGLFSVFFNRTGGAEAPGGSGGRRAASGGPRRPQKASGGFGADKIADTRGDSG